MSERKATKLKKVAAVSQEKIAKRLYDPETVMAEITRLAGLGYEHYRIVQHEHPIKLNETEAAKVLMKALKKHGLKHDWEGTQIAPEAKHNQCGYVCNFREIVISW